MAQVLVVCTGNICRSPMAEGFLKERFRSRSGQGEGIDVSSAGTSGWDGSPPTNEAIDAAAEREADITGHRARRLQAALVEPADLILGMTADHRDAAIQLVPTAAPRTFTLKELVKLVEALPDPGDPSASAADRLRERVRQADELRIGGFEGNPYDLDVADPIGLSIDTYRAVAWELDDLCTRLVDGLLGVASASTSSTSTAGTGTLSSLWKEGE